MLTGMATISGLQHTCWMEIRKGLDAWQATFAMKKYKSHQWIGVTAEILACVSNRDVHSSVFKFKSFSSLFSFLFSSSCKKWVVLLSRRSIIRLSMVWWVNGLTNHNVTYIYHVVERAKPWTWRMAPPMLLSWQANINGIPLALQTLSGGCRMAYHWRFKHCRTALYSSVQNKAVYWCRRLRRWSFWSASS
jgi:hypothetical protein